MNSLILLILPPKLVVMATYLDRSKKGQINNSTPNTYRLIKTWSPRNH